ncbi:Neuroblastoma-amplified sequence, partial [Stegodyphus mimosarum]
MIEEDTLDATENNILYELLFYAEWLQEPEVQTKTAADRLEEVSDAGSIRKWLGPLVQQPCPPLLLRQLTNLQMPWTLAIGGNGAVIAILQDNCLEIRTSRDEYGAVIGRTQVSKDPYPQWRKILWSSDCTMLALAYSNGKVDFYDLIGAHMFSIESKEPVAGNGKPDFRLAAAGMAFCDVRIKNTQWSYEFLIANYQGILMGYYISPTDGYKESHNFTFSSCYPLGISCFIYHPTDNIIIVSGKSPKLSVVTNTQDAMVPQMGLSAWRVIIGPPYYKLTLSLEEQKAYVKSKWWSSFSQHILYGSLKEDHLVFKMSISPNGKILAAVHLSGALSLWDLPSLRLKKYWPLQLQPNSTDINPQYCEPGMKRRADFLQTNAFYSHIIDINWWSNEAIIIVRRCGAVTVSSINSLRNLLGISPEWFEPSPAVTSFCDRGFLVIESEVCIKSKRRAVEDADLDDDESSDEEEPSVFLYSYNLARKGLYFITDSDRFQPPRKKLKMITKTYRLLCLKSTTPEELYSRKINLEEYGEALALAKTYNLDCDLVYQRQWRKMPATVESIHDYLSKITKRSWVLHECLERVPESFEAAKELLLYGLQGTDVKALIAIGKGEDHGRFILCSPYEDEDDHDANFDVSSYASANLMEDDMYEVKKKLQNKKRAELLKQVNFKK